MKKYVKFTDLYSFKGEYEYSAIVYNKDDNSIKHYINIKEEEGISSECGYNCVDGRESLGSIVITLPSQNKDLFVILFNNEFSLEMFHLVGSAYQKVEYIIPDDAPVEKIKELLMKDNQKWKEVKNGLGERLGYLLPSISIKVVSADEFYLKSNPFDEMYGKLTA